MAGYSDFKLNDMSIIGKPIKKMSKITQALLKNIDYEAVKRQRRLNYARLSKRLSAINEFSRALDASSVPLSYPLLAMNNGLKESLINKKIYIPTYWPNVLDSTDIKSVEYKLANNIIHLPIDQRYGATEMDWIIDNVLHHHETV